MMDVTIVIVSYNARADLERCLRSLHDTPPKARHEIIVVDNASSDGSARAATAWADVRVIESDSNRGFAAANNIGIRAGSGRDILLLNSDTVVPPDAVDRMLAVLAEHPEVAALGPRLVNGAGRAELSFGAMIGPVAEYRQRQVMRGLERGHPGIVLHVDAITRREQSPDWVSGACLLVRRADAEDVGMLDERYFMYAEDVDFCAALRRRGRRILFTPTVEVVHLRGRSALSDPAATRAAYKRSHLAFYRKHHPLLAPIVWAYHRLTS